MKGALAVLGLAPYVWTALPGRDASNAGPHYKLLPSLTQDAITVFPVLADKVFDTSGFLTLEEGLRTGQVLIRGGNGDTDEFGLEPGSRLDLPQHGLERPRFFPPPVDDGMIFRVPTALTHSSARGGELTLINHADRPLLLLGGEVVMAGRGQRVMNQEQIIPAHSDPVALDVFSPRRQLREEQAKAFGASVADPKFEKLGQQLQAEGAVGVVAALKGELTWVDIFASPALLVQYWPKLVRSYAEEARSMPAASVYSPAPGLESAQAFLECSNAKGESSDTQAGLYRSAEWMGYDFHIFILTALLPNTGFNIHMVKVRRDARGR